MTAPSPVLSRPSAPPAVGEAYWPQLNALRAFAVLVVMVTHFSPTIHALALRTAAPERTREGLIARLREFRHRRTLTSIERELHDAPPRRASRAGAARPKATGRIVRSHSHA